MGWMMKNKSGGRQAERGMKERKDDEGCGQVERNPSEQEARMCSPSPKSLRREGKKQTPV